MSEIDFIRMSSEEILEYIESEAKKKFEEWRKRKYCGRDHNDIL